MSNTVQIAQQIRELVIKSLTEAGSGHSAGALDLADILSVLYFSDLLHLDPSLANNPERDYIILSAGHTCPALYATLALRGFFPLTELDTLRQFGSRLQGHPHKDFGFPPITNHQSLITNNLPGIENTAGPLGQGTSFAVGLALGLKLHYQQGKLTRLPRVICLCGDGELAEGQCWEAFMAASKFKLNHLTFIIDRNGIQIDGHTETVMPLEPLKDKLTSFGLCTIEVNGHNHDSIYSALKLPDYQTTKPTAVLAHTIPGKGVSFMESDYHWHGKVPNAEQAEQALKELC